MVSVNMSISKTKFKPTSILARKLCNVLLNSPSLPAVTCPLTGILIKGDKAWATAQHFNTNASGAHYRAFGFTYILCHSAVEGEYVQVYRTHERTLVGTVRDPEEIVLAEHF